MVERWVDSFDLNAILTYDSYLDIIKFCFSTDFSRAIKNCLEMPLPGLQPILWGYLVFTGYMGV